jgi:ketosteroid isomerase-like protein
MTNPTLAQRQIEVTQRATEAFNAGDLDFLAQAVTSDFVWRPAIGTLESREYRGIDAMRHYWRDLGESFDETRFETAECRTVAADTVVILGRLHATGHSSGAAVSGERGIVARFRGERIASMTSYPSWTETIRIAQAGAPA